MAQKSRIVECIKLALEKGLLEERFSISDVRRVCKGFAKDTYPNFLPKHRVGNKGGYTEYFIRHKDRKYSLLKEFSS